MQVTDRNIGANPTGFDMRTEINNIIAALESDNSGPSEPLNTVAYMKWLDTSNATYYYYKERNHDNTAWVTLFRYTVATKIMEVVSNGVVLSDMTAQIHDATSKTTPVDNDEIGLVDSATSFTLKKLTWANLKATSKSYFDTLYVALTGNQSISGVKTFLSSPTVPTPAAGDNSTKIATTAFVLANAPVTPDATETVKGKVELATNAEVQAGTDTTRVITPAGMKAGLNASGDAPIYACRAWVNFNGTGTVAIRASGNVSSITDNGVGDYTVNFIAAMPDSNYTESLSTTGAALGSTNRSMNIKGTNTTAALKSPTALNIIRGDITLDDSAYISVSIFR